MKIIRERPCQRQHHRLIAPLSVSFDDHINIKSDNWSLGGLGLEMVKKTKLKMGGEVDISITLPFQGYEITFDVIAHVVRLSENGKFIGLKFIDLPERSYNLLSHFSENLIRGDMGVFEDSICRIDVPVTPISTEPSTSHVSDTPLRRFPIKTLIFSALYIVIGITVFSYLSMLVYSNFMRLEISSSVISTELQTIKMPYDGVIRSINFEVGSNVKAGEEILKIYDYKLESQINAANLKVDAAQKNIWRMEQRAKIEKERLKLYQIVNRTDMNIAAARLSSLREALKAADAHMIRINKLKKTGTVTSAQFDNAVHKQTKAASAVLEAELLLEKNTAMDAVSGRRHYNHKEFVADLDMMTIDLEMAYNQLEIEISKLEELERRKSKQMLIAPFDGRVVDLYQPVYSNVVRNDPVLLLEKNNDISVTAFLTQQEIMEVGLHDIAKVYIPALTKNFSAVVIKIDRQSLFINKKTARYTWREEQDRTAAVTLKLKVDSVMSTQISAGLPVIVIFKRQTTNEVWASLKSIFSKTTVNGKADGNYEEF